MANLSRSSAARGGGTIWLVILAILVIGIGALGYYLKRETTRSEVDGMGCLTNRPAPNASLFMVDATDRLTPDTAKYVIDAMRQQEAALPRYSRVIVVPFGDDTTAPLQPMFNGCLPGKSGDAGLSENGRYLQMARDQFDQTLTSLQDKLTRLPPSKSSPISAQVIRAVGDPVLTWAGDKRRLVLFTDGLESSIYWSRHLKLNEAPANILQGIDVQFVELGNPKAGTLQSDQMRQQWRDWFEKAGASVRMTAPGYAAAPLSD